MESEFHRLRETLPPAPAGVRENALADFVRRGFPSVRLEDWRYTNLRDIAGAGFSAAGVAAPVDSEIAARIAAAIGTTAALAYVDGRPIDTGARTLPPGVQLLPLAAAGDALGGTDAISRSSLVALNTAFCRSGAVLRVADGVVFDQPLHLVYATSLAGEARVDHVRTVISVGRRSRVTVVEHYLGRGDVGGWTNAATDITLAEAANLDHYLIQRQAPRAYHTADLAVLQAADSAFHSVSISLGARLCRNDIRSRLGGAGARCSLDGLYLASGDQHVDHHTAIEHAAPHCTSEELYKGILGGRAMGVFNGAVVVRNEGQRTDARQLNKNLLLSDAATINTKPQLEIFADDVKCSHGATTGRLDDEAVFFLRARGIDQTAARTLLTYAFANEIVERLAEPSLREQLEVAVREKLDSIVAAGSR